MTDDDLELLEEFRTESLEHFEQTEPLLLEIEEADGDEREEVVNAIFRAVHSVKGAAGFFELTQIQDLAHASESLLMKVRDGEIAYRSEMTDALLAALDKLRAMVEAVPEDLGLETEADLARLAELAERTAPPGGDSPPEAAPEAVAAQADASADPDRTEDEAGTTAARIEALVDQTAPAKLEEVRRFGQTVLAFDAAAMKDREGDDRLAAERLEGVGVVLADAADEEGRWTLYACVLEPELLAEELGLPVEQIHRVALPPLEPADAREDADADEPELEASAVAAATDDASTPRATSGKSGRGAGGDGAENIRVSVRLLDKLMNLAGELVLARNQLVSQVRDVEDNSLRAVLQNIDLVTSELQAGIMNTRMQPVGSVFKRFNRVVRDLSRSLGKNVRLEVEGSDVELDRSIIEMLSDPLTHLVRNALDHGIEDPEARRAAGKPETANLTLRAYHENGLVNIEVIDDGKGIDPDKMRDAAVAKGLMDAGQAAKLSDGDAVKLIFAAGFSTAAAVTDVSGRGVGMDVVRANIDKLGGTVDIDSVLGKGSQLRIRLPLTLAILPSLIVGVGDERFAIPQVNVVEVVRVHPADQTLSVDSVHGAAMLRHRAGLLPLVWLSQALEIPGVRRDWALPEGIEEGDLDASVSVLVLRSDENQYGLIVDQIHDTEEIVVKPLSEMLKDCRSFAGATIMGDGQVAMILDVGSVAQLAQLDFPDDADMRESAEALERADREAKKVLLFSSSPADQFAFDLDQIVRLERIQPEQIERVGGRDFMQYRDAGLPLVRLDEILPVEPFTPSGEDLFVVIPRVEGHDVGILVREVIDTVSADVHLESDGSTPVGVAGRAVIGGRLTMFLDPAGFFADGAPLGGGS